MRLPGPTAELPPRLDVLRTGAVWLCLFAALLALKRPILLAPPYHEYAETFWTEAAFLAATNFDYRQLVAEPQVGEGGVRAYVVSVLTVGLAWLMRSMSAGTLIPAAHILSLACASLTIAWTWALLRHEVGAVRGAVVVLAVFTMPLFNVHAEMLGMEWPLALAVLAVLTLYAGGRVLTAVAAAGIAFFVKPSVAPLEIALAACLAASVVLQTRAYRRAPSRHRLALALMLAIGAAQAMLLVSLTRDAQTVHPNLLEGFLGSMILGTITVPYLLPVVGYITWRLWVAAVTHRPAAARCNRPQTRRMQLKRRARILLEFRPGMALAQVYLWVALASMLLVFPIGRYFVALGAALAMVLAAACFSSNKPGGALPGHAVLALGALLAHNAVNQWGRLLPPLPPALELHERMLALPERSLRYRPDHASTIAAMRLVGTLSPGEPILAGKLATQFLCAPQMGYVPTPPIGYTVLDHYSLGQLRPAVEMLADRPDTLIVVGSATGECQLPPPEPGDEILYDDGLNPPLVVYRRRFSANSGSAPYEDFYRRLVLANRGPYIPYSVATVSGNDGRDPAWLRRRMARLDVAPDLLRWLAGLYEELGEPAVAEAARFAAENRAPASEP